MILNDNELALVRNTEHRTDLYISIYEPDTVFACQVDDASISKGARAVQYDGISQGSGTFIDADMLMLVGSSAGDDDVGSTRIKGVTGSYLYVAENSDIQWEDDQHLTILDYIAPNPIFPRIIQDPNNEEDVIFFKDWDIPYSDQNSVLGSFVCAGPHRAGFLEDGQYQADLSASGTYNVKGDGLTYNWNFGSDATPTGSAVRDPGLVSWSTVGHKSVKLIVSNDSGGEDVSYRYISIFDRPTEGNTLPPLKWELISFSENRGEGGVTARIRVRQILSGLRKHSLVVLWSEDWFGDEKVSLGGNYPGASDIFFNGFILDGSIHYDYRQSYTEFDVVSLTNVMKEIENFPISTEDSSNPNTWYKILQMNPPKAIYHYLRWHSTFLKLADVHYLDTTASVQYFDSGRESMYEGLHTFINTGMIGSMTTDRQGTIWIEKAPEGKTNGRTAYQIPMYLQKHDWVGEPDINERLKDAISYVELGGIAYTGVTGTSLAYIGAAPGISPASVGSVESNQGLILTSQSDVNQLAGNVFAYRNSEYPNASFTLKGNYRNLDIAPLENVPLTVDQDDTVRGVQLTAEPFHIQSMNWSYNPNTGYLYVSNINYSQLTDGKIGDTINIPVIPPTEIIIPPIPPISIPPIPPIELPPITITGTSLSPEVVLILDRNAGLLLSTNFDEDYPIWLPFNNGMPSGTYSRIGSVQMTPGGQLYVLAYQDPLPDSTSDTGGFEMWYAPYFGSSFGLVLTKEIVQSYVGAAYSNPNIASLGIDPNVQDSVALCLIGEQAGVNNNSAVLLYGSPNAGFGIKDTNTDFRNRLGDGYPGSRPMTYGDGKWVFPILEDNVFSTSNLIICDSDVSINTIEQMSNVGLGFAAARPVSIKRVGDSAKLYICQHGNGGTFAQSLNNGLDAEIVSTPGDPPAGYWQSFDCDWEGQYIMRAAEGIPETLQQSFDFGETFSTVTGTFGPTGTFAAEGADVIVNWDSNSLIWLVAKETVKSTDDFGASWADKSGNLTTIVPSPEILQIVIVQ